MKARAVIAAILVALLTIGPALLAGQYGSRWRDSSESKEAADQLLEFPTEFGVWKMVKEGDPLTDVVKEELGVASYVSRVYENRDNGANITLLLMVGQAGPLLRHPPNICYANRANRQVGDVTTFKASSPTSTSEFTAIEYERPDPVTRDRFVVAYGMTDGADWSVPKYPRVKFGAAPCLYKVQMLSGLKPQQSADNKLVVVEQFANDFTAAFVKLREGIRSSQDSPASAAH